MSYKNSQTGIFDDAKFNEANRDVIEALQTRTIKKDFTTMYFGNNTVNKAEDALVFSEAENAMANETFGEIRNVDTINREQVCDVPIEVSISGNPQALDIDPSPSDLINGINEAETRYVSVYGRVLDNLSASKTKGVTSVIPFGVGSSFKIKARIRAVCNNLSPASNTLIGFSIPAIPVYAKITAGTLGARASSAESKAAVVAPLFHLEFPFVIGNCIIKDETPDLALQRTNVSDRIIFENSYNERHSLGTCALSPFSFDLDYEGDDSFFSGNLRDVLYNNDTEVAGLQTRTLLSAYANQDISDFSSDHVASYSPDYFYNRPSFEDGEIVPSTIGNEMAKTYIQNLSEIFGESTDAGKALAKSDLYMLGGIKVYENQKILFTYAKYVDVQSDLGVSAEIEFSVVSISKAQNSLNGIVDNNEFYHGAEELVSIIPTSFSIFDVVGSGSTSFNTTLAIKDPMFGSSSAKLPESKEAPTIKDYPTHFQEDPFLLYISKDSSRKMYGVISSNNYNKWISVVLDKEDGSVVSIKSIPIPEVASKVRTKGFKLLSSDYYEDVILIDLIFTVNGSQEEKSYIVTVTNLELFPSMQLDKAEITSKYIVDIVPFIDGIVPQLKETLQPSPSFVDNSFCMSSVAPKDSIDSYSYFLDHGLYAIYQWDAINDDAVRICPEKGDTVPIYEWSGEYRDFHSIKTKPLYTQSSNISLLVGNSCYSSIINGGKIDLSIGESVLYFSRDMFSKAASIYSLQGGLKTYANCEILPLIYPVVMILKNNSYHPFLKTATTDNSISKAFVYKDLPVNLIYIDTDICNQAPTHNLTNQNRYQFLYNSFISIGKYQQVNAHFLSIDINKMELSSNAIGSLYEDGGKSSLLLTPFLGCIVVSNSPSLSVGGAVSNIEIPASMLGTDLTLGDIVWGRQRINIKEADILIANNKIYNPSSFFTHTSSLGSINNTLNIDFGTKFFPVEPYLFVSNNKSTIVYYSDRNIFSRIFSTNGSLMSLPSSSGSVVVFGCVRSHEIIFYKIEKGDVKILSIITLDRLLEHLSIEYEDNAEYSIEAFLFSSDGLNFSACSVVVFIDGVRNYLGYMVNEYGVSLIEELAVSDTLIAEYLSSVIKFFVIDESNNMFSLYQERTSGEYTFKLKSAPIDLTKGFDSDFIPTGIEFFARKERQSSPDRFSYSIKIYNSSNMNILHSCDDYFYYSSGITRVESNFNLDILENNSFIIEIEISNGIVREIAILGYLINKD